MEDFIFETEVKITVKPVAPKTGQTQRGPFEKNMTVITSKAKKAYVGAKTDVQTLADNALSVVSRLWALSANEPPEGYTTETTPLADTTATLNGKVHDHGVSTVVTFEYGTTPDLGTSATAAQSPLTGDALTAVSAAITSLTASTQYYFRIKMVSGGVTIYTPLDTFVTSA